MEFISISFCPFFLTMPVMYFWSSSLKFGLIKTLPHGNGKHRLYVDLGECMGHFLPPSYLVTQAAQSIVDYVWIRQNIIRLKEDMALLTEGGVARRLIL